MKDLTRREFIHTVAGAAVGGTIVCRNTVLQGEVQAALASGAGHGNYMSTAELTSLDSLIFPKPQEISSSGNDFILDSQVPIVIPTAASEQDVLLANVLANELSDRFGLHLKIERATSSSVN